MALGFKTGGRAAGTPNKRTKELKQILQEIVAAELENLPSILATLSEKERVDTLVRLLPYILPKPNTVHYSTLE